MELSSQCERVQMMHHIQSVLLFFIVWEIVGYASELLPFPVTAAAEHLQPSLYAWKRRPYSLR